MEYRVAQTENEIENTSESEADSFIKNVESGSELSLDKMKSWLFRENIRLISKEKELERMKEQFDAEKEQFTTEMKEWSKQIRFEKTRLEQESKFFDKKFKLLEQGFKQLAADKDKFAAEKRAFEYRKKFYQATDEYESRYEYETSTKINVPSDSFFFKGVHNQSSLKKRYKELLKIFHPDNVSGDTETVNEINREYEALKKLYVK